MHTTTFLRKSGEVHFQFDGGLGSSRRSLRPTLLLWPRYPSRASGRGFERFFEPLLEIDIRSHYRFEWLRIARSNRLQFIQGKGRNDFRGGTNEVYKEGKQSAKQLNTLEEKESIIN